MCFFNKTINNTIDNERDYLDSKCSKLGLYSLYIDFRETIWFFEYIKISDDDKICFKSCPEK